MPSPRATAPLTRATIRPPALQPLRLKRETTWLNNMAYMNTTGSGYWDSIHPIDVQRFRNVQLYPSINQPDFNQQGGAVPAGFQLYITHSEPAIYYTLDGNEPNQQSILYSSPISIDKTTTVKAIAVSPKGKNSQVTDATYRLIPNNWTVKIASKYSNQYTGGGDEGLIDGIRGTTTFASGEWQGYQGQDFIATVDLQKEIDLHSLGAGFLQVAGSWIWMPTFVQFEVSDDGVNFRRVVDIKTDVPVTDMDPVKRDYARDIPPTHARYIRVHAYNLGKIPSWHPGAGGDAWIFVDEILIN